MIWEAISKLLLLGTSRGQLPPQAIKALEQVGVNTQQPAEQLLLEALALYHQLRQAGFPYSKVPPAESRPEDIQHHRYPPRLQRLFPHIFKGNYRQLLPEFIALCQEHKLPPPPEYWPQLFHMAVKAPTFWAGLRQAMPPFAHRLLLQNPDWQAIAESAPGANAPLPAVLRRYRWEAPQNALDYLSERWESLGFMEKKQALEAFDIQLGGQDEPFLTAALGDTRKEVRQKAAALLAQIPGSAVQEALQRASVQYLSAAGPAGLSLLPPAAPDDDLKNWGLQTGKTGKYPGGKGTAWAFEAISKVRPAFWEAHFKTDTVKSVRLFTQSNRQKVLTDAIANAALLHQDHTWIEALLRHWWRTGQAEKWASALGKQLMEALPSPAANAIARQHLSSQSGSLEEQSFIAHLLSLGTHTWEDDVALSIVGGLREWIGGAKAFYWNLWHYKRLLQVAAQKASPSILPQLEKGWPQRSPVWGQWEKDVEQLMRTLAFRRDLRQAMAEEARNR